jgi:nitrogen fixation protein FixH
MNWGKGILIAIIVFLAGTAVMVMIAINSETGLVAKNYYELGINYQEKIDRINRTNALPEKVVIEFSSKAVSISIPRMFERDKIKGDIIFYKPSNAKDDFRVPLQVDSENKMFLGTDKLERGFWKIQVDWSADTVKYFNEFSFTIK